MGRLALALVLGIGYPGLSSPQGVDYVLEEQSGVTLEYPSGSQRMARGALRILEESRPLVEKVLGIVPGKAGLRITIAPNPPEFLRIVREASQGGVPPRRALAVALPRRNQMVIKASALEAFTTNSLRMTVRHELVHLALSGVEQLSASPLPRWFDEGVAEYVAGKGLDWNQRGALRAAARGGTLPALEEISRSFPAGEEWSSAYEQSLAFVQYYTDEFGDEALRGLLQRLITGSSLEEGIRAETGVSLERLESRWREELLEEGSFLKDLLLQGTHSFEQILFRGMALLVILFFLIVMIRRRRALRRMEP